MKLFAISQERNSHLTRKPANVLALKFSAPMTSQHSLTLLALAVASSTPIPATVTHPTSTKTLVNAIAMKLKAKPHAFLHFLNLTPILVHANALLLLQLDSYATPSRFGIKRIAYVDVQLSCSVHQVTPSARLSANARTRVDHLFAHLPTCQNNSAMEELYGTTNSVPASAESQETVLITQESPSTTLTMSVLASVIPLSQDAEIPPSTTHLMSVLANAS